MLVPWLLLVPLSSSAQDPLFGPGKGLELTLEGALELALANNIGLQVENLSTEVALRGSRGAWGTFDWVLETSLGRTEDEFESSSVFGGSQTDSNSYSIDFTRPLTTGGSFGARYRSERTETDSTFSALTASTSDVVTLSYAQPLLRGAWRQYATSVQRIADLAWRRQVEREREVRQRLLLDVSHAYWDLVAAREELDVAVSAVRLAEAQLDLDRRRLDAGIGTEIDVLSAEAQVATREERRLFAEVTVRGRADALRVLILPGIEADRWETALVPSTPLPAEVEPAGVDWGTALLVAREHRPDLRQQRLRIEEERSRFDQRLSERRATLDFNLSATGKGFDESSSQAMEEALGYDFPTYQATLVFRYPLGNTTAREAERSAWAALRGAILSYDDLETRAAGDVRDALRQVSHQAEAVRATKKSLDLARRQLQAEERRREEGISTNFQVLQFQMDLTQAMSNERAARVNHAKALASMALAQGILGEAGGR